MSLIELFIIAVGLSMDAFAVSVCKGLSVGVFQRRYLFLTGAWFGGFQALMPLLGYLSGIRFQHLIARVDHWIAFVLLSLIGVNMLREACETDEKAVSESFRAGAMLPLAVATSIDALVIGITFAFLQVDIVPAVCLIGLTTFILSGIGVKVGCLFGIRYKASAERAGGAVLILMGVKILLEHLGFL